MSLSNTATPKYYGEFRDAVLRGEIPVCEHISLQMNLIDELIANPGVYYDESAMDGFVAFCEEELTLTDGSDVTLMDSFKLWAEDILCWFYFIEMSVYVPGEHGQMGHYEKKVIKRRLRHKQYIIVARSAAKSVYASFLHNYFLNVDTTTTHQIATAPTMKQAEEVITPIKTSITRAKGPLFKMLTATDLKQQVGMSSHSRTMLTTTKRGIENFLTGSWLETRPMRIDKLQGLQVKFSTVDEWKSGDTREDPIGAIEQGAAKVDDYLIVAISSEGTVRNGVGDTICMELEDILKGKYQARQTSIWWYNLDSIEEVGHPELWLKAQPNLGVSVSYETYQADVERAEHAPGTRNDILAKRFGIPMEGFTYYFSYAETLPHPGAQYWDMQCSMGIDMSQGDDFCAFTFLFPLPDGSFGIKTRCYITERTLFKLPKALREKYNDFIQEGSLIVMPQITLDAMLVYDDVEEFIERNRYDVITVGYDPYNAKEFIERWELENSAYGIVKVPQGRKTETVPLGELKIYSEERMLRFDELLFSFTMGNCIVLKDTNNNKMLAKNRNDEKIDAVAALLDAYVAFKAYSSDY